MLARIIVAVALLGVAQSAALQTRKVSVESLLYDLKHPDVERRRQAASWLGQNRVHTAVPGLIVATHDSDDGVRLAAARALVAIRDQSALEAYVGLLQDEKKDIRLLAIDGIVDLYVMEEGGFMENVRKVADFVNPLADDFNPRVVDTYVEVDSKAIRGIASRLRDRDVTVRRRVAVALGILRGREALPEIQAVLEAESSSGVRVELIRAMYKIADPDAARSLIRLIRDDDKKVHDEAIYTLGRLRVTEAASYLKELYNDGIEERRKILKVVPVSGKDDLQRNLFRAMAYIGHPDCKDLFEVALTDPSNFYRRYGAEGLARVGDQNFTISMARSFLHEKDDQVRLAMSYALYRMGRREHLDNMVRSLSRNQVHGYLLELGPQRIPELYPYLEHGDANTIAKLLEIVGLRGDREALAIVERYARSENPQVISAANLAVRRLRARGISGS